MFRVIAARFCLARRSSTLLSFFVVSLATCALLPAQVTNIGDTTSTPVPGAGHNYLGTLNETVNPANGAVSVRIAVPMPPGRKLTVPFSFAYDSNGALVLGPTDSGLQWQGSTGTYFPGSGGWSYSVPVLTANTQDVTLGDGMETICRTSVNYVYQDPSGARHPLYLSITGWAGGTKGFTDCSTTEGQYTDEGDDLVQAHTNAIASSSYWRMNAVTLADADGTVVSFPTAGTFGKIGLLPSSITDRNGNTVTVNGTNPWSSFSYTDTLNRTALSVTYGSRPGTDTVSVSGLGASYSATWGSATFTNTNLSVSVYSGSCGVAGIDQSIPVISTLTLPNGETYKFYYDPTYGAINEIVYPTGAYVRYVWGFNSESEAGYANGINAANGQPWSCSYYYATPVITDRYVSYDGSTETLHQHFAHSPTTWKTGQYASQWSSKVTTVTTTDTLRNASFQTVYTYAPVYIQAQPNTGNVEITNQAPVENQIQYYDWGGTTLLRTVNKSWFDQNLMACSSATQGSLTSRTDFTYSNDYLYAAPSQVTDKKEWDWGQTACPNPYTPPTGTPTRVTKILNSSGQLGYQTFSATSIYPYGPSIFDRPYRSLVYAAGTWAAETDYSYDSIGDALAKTGVCSGCTNAVTHYGYDGNGQTTSMTDPNGNVTSYCYGDVTAGCPSGGSDAYLTQVSYPATNGVQHIEKFDYVLASGELADSYDENNMTTSYFYGENGDKFARLTGINYPNCVAAGICTSTNHSVSNQYSDGGPTPSVKTTKLLAVSGSPSPLVTTAITDGFGHPIESDLTSDPSGPDKTVTTLDGMARAWKVTNPYQSIGDPTYGLTTFTYDALGRPSDEGTAKSILRPDGSAASTVNSANCVTVIDEGGKYTRTSCSDGLGRVTSVQDAAGTTGYTYDALNNLLTVSQYGQSRSFNYDSLSRLTSATNPESGIVHYSYDANGNVSARTDNRSIVTTYSYDALNRLTGKSYNDGVTASVAYYYDESYCAGLGACFNVGHRTSMADGAGSEHWAYDRMGRLDGEQRTTNGVTKYFSYSFNLDPGTGIWATNYADGRIVSLAFNSANRPVSASDASNSFAQSAVYYPPGELNTLSEGVNGSYSIALTQTFSNRLQPNAFSAAANGNSVMSLSYNFNPGSDNGNVMSIANNRDSTRTQTFTYDSLNRIATGQTATTSGSMCWGKNFNIDAYGNLYSTTALSGDPCQQTQLSNLVINGNNQATASGYVYDGAGNMTNDGVYGYTYDAEGHQLSAAGVNYSYDGDGNRVKKDNGTLYWYGAGAEVLSETDLNGNNPVDYVYFGGQKLARVPSSGGPNYYLQDHLGTSRVMVAAGASAACYESDFEPYGTEHTVTNTCAQNYKFAGMERDAEAVMEPIDHTKARQYPANLGRWLSPDPDNAGAHEEDPQTWNGYAYVGNNPTSRTDPNGEDYYLLGGDQCGTDGVTCDKQGYVTNGKDRVVVSDQDFLKGTNGVHGSVDGNGNVSITTAQGTFQGEFTGSIVQNFTVGVGHDEAMAMMLQSAGQMAQNGVAVTAFLTAPAYLVAAGATIGLAGGETAALGTEAPSAERATQVIFRAQQLAHATRVAAGHNTPLGTVLEIKAAIQAAVSAGEYTVGAGGVVRGTVMIEGVEQEFTGWLNAAGQVIFSNIYQK